MGDRLPIFLRGFLECTSSEVQVRVRTRVRASCPLIRLVLVIGLALPADAATGILEALRQAERIEFDLPWSVDAEGFNLRLDVREPRGVRVALNYQDAENGYVMEFQPAEARLDKIQCGLVLRLASGALTGCGEALRIKRRADSIELFEGDRRVLRYFDTAFRGGRVGLSGDGLSTALQSPPRLQRVGPIVFSDDFMRGENEPGEWTPLSGEWKVKALDHALRSANAFKYEARAASRPAVAVAGNAFWDRYEFLASFHSSAAGPSGLIFAWHDDQNFLRFEWSAAGRGSMPCARLVRCRAGDRQVLWSAAWGYQPGQWYRLGISLDGDRVRLAIDGQEIAQAAVSGLSEGQVGLFTESEEGTLFDDVQVRSLQDFHADFSDLERGRWRVLQGVWKPEGGGCEVGGVPSALAVTGEPDWHDYTVSAEVSPARADSVGMVFLFQDAGHFDLFTLERGSSRARLLRVREGRSESLAETPWPPARDSGKVTLSVRARRGVLSATVNGQLVVQGIEDAQAAGLAGLFLRGGPARIHRFSVQFEEDDRRALGAGHRAFTSEVSMANWASPEAEWTVRTETLGGAVRSQGRHRLPMPGDVEVFWPLAGFPPRDARGSPIPATAALSVSGDETGGPESGYALELSSGPGPELKLRRAGQPVVTRLLEDVPVQSLRLRRDQACLLGYLNGSRVVSFHDEAPLPGDRLHWSASGFQPDPARLQVYTQRVSTDTFEAAPVDWLVADGLWQVSNRWQCDPRWSFFSGKVLGPGRPVVIWCKRMLDPESIAVEVVIGQKMQQELGRGYQDYARDYNLTLCADGKDLVSGYSFVFGGWKNKGAAILRGREVVARAASPTIDAGGLHLRWYVLRAQVRQGRISYFIDDHLVLSYDDPSPLSGTRMAIWSYENSIMVARVRVAAPGAVERIRPFEWQPVPCPTFYDE